MRSSVRKQAIWLARGAALGISLRRLLRALHASLNLLRDIGLARRKLPQA